MFKKIFIELLKEKGITQSQLSKEAKIPPTTISEWTKANRKPDYEALKKLSKYFNVTADYLLGLEDEDGTKIESRKPEARNETLINNSFNNNSGNLNIDIKHKNH